MTQRQECLCYCIDHLESRSLGYTFNSETFNSYYDKHHNPVTSIYSIAINAADAMIESFTLNPVNND